MESCCKIQGVILRKLLLILAVLFSSWVYASEAEVVNRLYRQLTRLNENQLKIMLYSYEAGLPHDLGYALAAIAWKESKFGLYLMNISDGKMGSYGVYHILMDTAAARNKLKTSWDRSRFAERLVFELDLCADEAIAELTYWKRFFKRSATPWKAMFAGYNAGHKGLNSIAGKAYADDAVLRVKALQKYFRAKGLEAKLAKK